MASLNDYYMGRAKEVPAPGTGVKIGGMLLKQLMAATLIVVAVVFLCRGAGDLNYTMRTFVRQSLAMEASWLFGEEALAVSGSSAKFFLPAEGLAVKSYASDGKGGYRVDGISILPGEGKNVKASSQGLVVAVRGSAGDYSLQVNHANGIATVYKGLATVVVAEGDSVKAEQQIGIAGMGNIFFGLYIDGIVADPDALLSDR